MIDVQKEDPLARIMEITGGKGVDVALDCTAGAGTIPILLGIEALKRKGGTIVVQGEMTEFPNFPLEKVTVKFITMKSARGHSYKACELALAQLASKRFPLEKVTTHRFGLKDVDLAISSVGGAGRAGRDPRLADAVGVGRRQPQDAVSKRRRSRERYAHLSRARMARPMIQSLSSSDRNVSSSVKWVMRCL